MSLKKFYMSRARWFWISNWFIPAHVGKDGKMIPGYCTSPGVTYRKDQHAKKA